MLIDRRQVIVGAAALGFTRSAWAAPAIPASKILNFNLIRKDDVVGHHTLHFDQQADRLTVTVEAEIKVSFGPIVVFRYTHHNVEVWEGDKLISLDATTDDDGTALKMSAHREGDALIVSGTKAARYSAPPEALASTYWNKKGLSVPLINTQDGKLMHPTVTPAGKGPVQTMKSTVQATRYNLTGDLKLDLWYDDQDQWTSLQLKGGDDSIVDYRLA